MSRAAFSLIAVFVFGCLVVNLQAEDWTRFRGPNGSGISPTSTAPISWSADKNMKWSVDLPGLGSSCPIVLGDRVYLTCYTGFGVDKENPGKASDLKRHLISFDRSSGDEVWRTTIDSANEEDEYKGFIQEHGYASSTPVTDGKHIYVLFGKTGVVAFDMDGKKVWTQNVGTQSDPYKWGGGSSCVLFNDLVIVNAGIVGNKICALNKSDGSEAWSVKDAKFTNCWSTPILVKADERDELVFSLPGKILALDPASGKELWSAKSPIDRTVCASLAENKGVVFAMGGQGGVAVAIKCGGSGDVSESHTVWTKPLRAGIGTPVVSGDKLFWNSSGIANCADCETGESIYKERLPKKAAPQQQEGQRRSPAGDYASPIVIGDNVIMVLRNGSTYVVKASGNFELVGQNSFGDDKSLFNATPAVSDNQIFIRSNEKLYCIQE